MGPVSLPNYGAFEAVVTQLDDEVNPSGPDLFRFWLLLMDFLLKNPWHVANWEKLVCQVGLAEDLDQLVALSEPLG